MAANIRFRYDSWLKQDVVLASKLAPEHKCFIAKGTELSVDKISTAPGGHFRVTLTQPQGAYKTWLVYGDHIDAPMFLESSMQLKVPYYSQRDNREQWWRTCNTSSHAMLAEFLKPGCVNGSDDTYFEKYVKPRGDTTDHRVHTLALQALGIESVWLTRLGYDDLDAQLGQGIPVPIAVLHRGTIASPSGGHVLLVVGKYTDGYICHDPWGEGFSYQNHKGDFVRYPYQSLAARWLVGGEKTGWGRIAKKPV